jgi:hypothetical protein
MSQLNVRCLASFGRVSIHGSGQAANQTSAHSSKFAIVYSLSNRRVNKCSMIPRSAWILVTSGCGSSIVMQQLEIQDGMVQ